VTRKLSVINLSRSRNPILQIVVQMPARTPGGQVSELIEVVRAYIAQCPSDWVSLCSTSISPPDYKVGVIEVKLFPLSAHLKIHDVQLDQATSRMYLFIHVYMQSAGMEYVQPRQEILATIGRPADAPGVAPCPDDNRTFLA
jgi:hypothetical protein